MFKKVAHEGLNKDTEKGLDFIKANNKRRIIFSIEKCMLKRNRFHIKNLFLIEEIMKQNKHRPTITNLCCAMCPEVLSNVWVEKSNAWLDIRNGFHVYCNKCGFRKEQGD